MQCSKFARECKYISKDNNLIFVLMPFLDTFDNVFDALQSAMKEIQNKQYNCTRADENFTNHSIWCENICKPIRKAKYLIVDITGRNANVFYELGFSHAFENTEAIIITQDISHAPFDIKDLGLIKYSLGDFKKLRTDIVKAINDKDEEKEKTEDIPKTSEEVIGDLKQQLRDEENRSSNFKKERKESEDREQKLKDKIREIEAIKSNPAEEAIKRIGELESSIAEYKSKLKYTEEDKKAFIVQMKIQLKEKEEKLKKLEQEFEKSKQSKDNKPLSELLMDESAKEAEALKWFNQAFSSKDYNKAIESYKKALEIKPSYLDAWINLGWNYHEIGDYMKAIESYKNAIDIKPDYFVAWFDMGNVNFDIGNYDNAKECFQKVIDIRPDDNDAWNNMGVVYIEKGDFDKAIECLQKVIDKDNNNEKAWCSMGVAFDNKSNYDKAIECYYKAIDIDPTYGTPWNNLGFIYIKIGEIVKAEDALNKAVLQRDGNMGYMNLGHLFLIKKEEEKAIEYYKKCIKSFNDQVSFFKGFDDDYKYLVQYGINKEKYSEIRSQLLAFIKQS